MQATQEDTIYVIQTTKQPVTHFSFVLIIHKSVSQTIDSLTYQPWNIEKGDWVALVVVGGATGISGIPKVFFTPGTLSTVKLEKREQIGIRKKNKRSIAKVHLCFYYAVESGKTSF